MLKQKCEIITIIGAPNAGKSSLVNKLTGEKISIVSNKVQTTRNIIRGIAVKDNTQLIYVDTPGLFKAKQNLEKAIVEEALMQLSESELILFILDCTKVKSKNVEFACNLLRDKNKKAILVINKVDLIAKPKLLQIAAEFNELGLFSQIFMISARDGHGVSDLENHLISNAREFPFLYPEDQISDLPIRFLASEITREKLFRKLREEVPYNISVETESFKEEGEKIIIHQVIYVAKDGQKKIIIGKKGEFIKDVGTKSRLELNEILGKNVNIFLHVKVKEDWLNKPYMYEHMNLRFPK